VTATRPLDRLRSIKTKLGVLVAVTVGVAAVLSTAATGLGLSPFVTVPAAVAAALLVTHAAKPHAHGSPQAAPAE
jgi:ABC-type glucose/galactose transport system permease subunit